MTRQYEPVLTSPQGQGNSTAEGIPAAGSRRAASSRRLAGCLAACLLLSGCAAGGTRPLAVPFGLGSDARSLSEAVAADPFPDAAEVGLQM
jgi:hypothetical protein